ncbi:MAG: hypothetical protein N2378_10665, partial [Chloroflexaceae bacterium]|nr:hypothetical protein [Chloroflexaceae bacterium]
AYRPRAYRRRGVPRIAAGPSGVSSPGRPAYRRRAVRRIIAGASRVSPPGRPAYHRRGVPRIVAHAGQDGGAQGAAPLAARCARTFVVEGTGRSYTV